MIAGDLLGERARLTPDKLALVDVATGARYSYAELDARATRMAASWTKGLGLGAGDRIGLLAHNRVEYVDAFFAAGKCGVILVPLSTRATGYELAGIAADAGLSALLYESGFEKALDVLRREAEIPRYVSLDDQLPGAEDPLEAPVPRDPEHLWALLYTSGTTGKPKGVMVPHRQVLWNGYNTTACWQLREDDISPVFTPLYHAGGLGAFLVPIFTIGGTIVLHRGFDAGEVWQTIETERCTVVLGVPAIWKLLMEHERFATVDLGSVRWLISGGAPLPTYIIEAYQSRGVGFKQGFGMTEVGVNCFAMTLEDSERKRGSIGKPLMLTEARVADQKERVCAPDEVGELQFRGPHVCAGYWKQPGATAAAFNEEGWFKSGDMARRDADGFFYIAGRSKDMYISGGVNVYPAEIEALLLQHPGVQDAAVIGVEDERWGESGVAFVVARESPLEADALKAFLAERIAKYKLPREFRVVEALPRTPYGKVVKAELHRLYSEGNQP